MTSYKAFEISTSFNKTGAGSLKEFASLTGAGLGRPGNYLADVSCMLRNHQA